MNYRLTVGLLLSSVFLSPGLFAGMKTIYGQDGRQDVGEFVGSLLRSKSQSVAGMVAKSKLSPIPGGYQFEAKKLTDYGMCPSVNFSSQHLLPDCTGFMIADDLLMTAGHCIEKYSDCADFAWVFNYDSVAAKNLQIADDQLFNCKRIVKREYDVAQGVDYAIIQLQHKASLAQHPPLQLAKREFALGDAVAMIGHPSSLPLKITTGGNTVKLLENAVRVSLDAFGGNSGSPVFDRHTGEVLGMLTGGGTDFVDADDDNNACKVEFKCHITSSGDECGGEDVFKISRAPIAQLIADRQDDTLLLEAVVEQDTEMVKYLIKQGESVDESVFGWSPLLQAVLVQNHSLVKLLLKADADADAIEQFDHGNALIVAISLGNEEIAMTLLEHGINLDQVTKDQQETALTLAIQKEMLELSQALIEAGARTDLKTKDGHTAADFADFIGSSELLELLAE